MVVCLEQGADLHMAQLMPLPSLSLASVKSRLVLPFWFRLTWVVPEKGPLNGCVCVCMTRVLGVLFTPFLALKKQVTSVSVKCFFQLRQLRHVRRSLDRDSVATLVHAFVTSHIDYGNALLTNAPKIWTEKL